MDRTRIFALLAVGAALVLLLGAPAAATNWEHTYRVDRKKAEAGDAKAQQNLGALYYHGNGVAQDREQAAHWWRKAADQGDAQAQYNLATLYMNGEGVERNYAEAARLFRLSADAGFGAARESLRAVEAFGSLNAQGASGAGAAQLLVPASGDPGDLARNAEAGHAASQRELGTLYYHGEGVPRDLAAAERWYRAAAEQGDAIAQFNLASMVAHGEGELDPDPVQAVMWLDLSKDSSHSSKYLLFRLEGELSEAQLAEGRRRAAQWRADRAAGTASE